MKYTQIRGFTLIEVMIVVAVIGILASVAYPSYTSSVQKGRRAQARLALSELMQQQERYFTQRNTYLSFTSSGSGASIVTLPATASTVFKVYTGDGASDPKYRLSAGVCDATTPINECVKVMADLTSSGTDPEVNQLSVLSTGTKDCSGTAKTTDFKLCWP